MTDLRNDLKRKETMHYSWFVGTVLAASKMEPTTLPTVLQPGLQTAGPMARTGNPIRRYRCPVAWSRPEAGPLHTLDVWSLRATRATRKG